METYLVPMWVVECGVQRDGCISMVAAADAQATVDRAKAEGVAEVRSIIQQRLIDVRLARSVARLSFAQDECDAQINVLESILKQCEKPLSSNNENGPDWQATVEALQRERDEWERKCRELCQAHGVLLIEHYDVKKALDAEREKAAQQGRYAVDLFDEIQRMKKAWCEERAGFESDLVKAEIERDKLQALVRALPNLEHFDVGVDDHGGEIRLPDGHILFTATSRNRTYVLEQLLKYRATLDVTTPAAGQMSQQDVDEVVQDVMSHPKRTKLEEGGDGE